ncbi:MAG: hypothetical protein LBQ69_00945 [Treponema sp.]|jgi:electron transport complex protein RnfA|nr:hypothetical protein [Treponema sp.]
MAEGFSRLVMLAVFSGLSMNLVLQFGLGLKELAMAENTGCAGDGGIAETAGKKWFLAGLGILFVTVLLLWLLFSFFRYILPLGLLEYFLLFPASVLAFSALEFLAHQFALKKNARQEIAFAFGNTFTGGALAGAALFVTLNVADRLGEAAVLSLGFTCGIALAVGIVGEIRRRSQMEAVPRHLRGGPLALVAMGLLSLIFSSAALMFFEVLGA